MVGSLNGVTEFLSDAWIRTLDARLSAAKQGSSPTPVTVQYLVETNDETVEYYLTLDAGRDSATPGRAEQADVTFSMDEATALAVSSGELSTEEAFIMGRLKIEGDPTPLVVAYKHDPNA